MWMLDWGECKFKEGKIMTFEEKWHRKIVKPKGLKYNVPDKEYFVTSALEYETETIFAIKALDYSIENKHWITFHLTSEDAAKLDDGFEILRDGWEECRPKIIDEVVSTWTDNGDHYLWQYSSYVFAEKCGKVELPKSEIERLPFPEEYMFIYNFPGIQIEDKPLTYLIPIPNFDFEEDVEDYVRQFRDDILTGNVMFGINKRLIMPFKADDIDSST